MTTYSHDNAKATLAAAAVILRSARLGLIEKIAEQFNKRLQNFERKKDIYKTLAGETPLYGDALSDGLLALWKVEGLGERFFDPGVCAVKIDESTALLRDALNGNTLPELTATSTGVQNVINTVKRDPGCADEETVNAWFAFLDPSDWSTFFHDAVALLQVFALAAPALERLSVKLQRYSTTDIRDRRRRRDYERDNHNNETLLYWDDQDDWLDYLLWHYVDVPAERAEAHAHQDSPFIDGGHEDYEHPGVVEEGAVAAAATLAGTDSIPNESQAGAYS